MIVTVTPNPSVDRTIEVAHLEKGAVIRALSERVDAGGKGVNVARALARHGHKAVAVVTAGGAEGAQLLALLHADHGLDVHPVAIGQPVRSNITVVEADGTTTKLNEAGPTLSRAELDAMENATIEAAEGADWVVMSGSLPPGAPADWYARLCGRLAPTGARVAIDTSGPALTAALATRFDLLKPNGEELAELTGQPVPDVEAARRAARLLTGTAGQVLVSLGRDGALLVTEERSWHATAPAVRARSSVGAGDALLAGFLASGGHGPDSLLEGVAWGSAAVSLPGSRMPAPGDIRRDGITLTTINHQSGETT